MIIVLTGIDGAGKSTAGRLLTEALNSTGRRAVFTANRSGRRTFASWCDRYGVRPPAAALDAVETAVRCFNVLLSQLRHRTGSGTVVMDRYLYCQMALRRTRGLSPGRILPRLAAALPLPDVVFHFELPAETAHTRIARRNTDSETLEHLAGFAEAYRELPEYPSFVVLDARRPPSLLVRDMLVILESCGPGTGRQAQGVRTRAASAA
ncbi:thymidylate kinase [Arthrobacter gandavensis]|uniref:dTMP kinase n=1 Tax=Arthrobacter gandavensis TaxID=169960 RepID=UPI00188E440E|nr:dTMP kinase [Arthrobacter gandavensis]MBF4993118.1 thymidylate kinase [Arthrobacter gandavensis]